LFSVAVVAHPCSVAQMDRHVEAITSAVQTMPKHAGDKLAQSQVLNAAEALYGLLAHLACNVTRKVEIIVVLQTK
jgi:hypothetical protein